MNYYSLLKLIFTSGVEVGFLNLHLRLQLLSGCFSRTHGSKRSMCAAKHQSSGSQLLLNTDFRAQENGESLEIRDYLFTNILFLIFLATKPPV